MAQRRPSQSHSHRAKTDQGRHYLDRPVGLLLIIAYKGIWGVLEILSGWLLLYSYRLFTHELLLDPQNLLTFRILRTIHIAPLDTLYLGLLFIGFGAMKLLLAVCLWHRIAIIREFGLVVFGLVGLYGLYHLSFHFSWITLIAFLLDVLTLVYFWKLLPKHLNRDQEFE